MVNFILGPQEHHGVKTLEEYAEAQRLAIERLQARGMRYEVHESPDLKYARVDHNTWLIDCECGAGNAVHPQWNKAYCFGCGAVHTHLRLPVNYTLIERLLIARPIAKQRNWKVDEPIENLEEENRIAGHEVTT